jgi:hypothetical protein
MAGTRSEGSVRRFFLYLLLAVPIAAGIFALITAIGSAPPAKVAFDVTLKVSGQDIRAGGTTYLHSDTFSFEGGRLSFAGTVAGDEVSVRGKVTTTAGGTATRDFKASGQLKGEQLSLTVNGDGGRRLGTMKLELINR